jgi:hypothetical protein
MTSHTKGEANMETNSTGNYSGTRNSSGPNWWLWIAIVVGSCCCLTIAGFVGLFVYFGRTPENVSVQYEMPTVVKNGQTFDMVLKITNTGSEAVTVNDIDLDEAFGGSFLDGCIVLETEPFMERDYSIEGFKTFHYNQPIPPGESRTVTFHLQATTVGEFGGSVGVYVGNLSNRIDYVGIIVQE